jgi:hypothetical protein
MNVYPGNIQIKEVDMPLLLSKEQELKSNLNQYQTLKNQYVKLAYGANKQSPDAIKMNNDLIVINQSITDKASQINQIITAAPFNSVLYKKYGETNDYLNNLIKTLETQKQELLRRQEELDSLEGQINDTKIQNKQSNLFYMVLIIITITFAYGTFVIVFSDGSSGLEKYFFILSIIVIAYFVIDAYRNNVFQKITDPVVKAKNTVVDTTTSLIENY